MRLFRVHNKGSGEIGRFWSYHEVRGPGQAQLDLALLPDWGNKAEAWTVIEVPAGTRIFEGNAAPQFYNRVPIDKLSPALQKMDKLGSGASGVLPGGVPQVIIDIDKVPKEWIVGNGIF